MVRENQSQRDAMKVAQYEVLGNDAKRPVRPARDDRNVRLLVSHAAQRLPPLVDRPVRDRDGYSLKKLTQHFVLGYFHLRPYRTASPGAYFVPLCWAAWAAAGRVWFSRLAVRGVALAPEISSGSDSGHRRR